MPVPGHWGAQWASGNPGLCSQHGCCKQCGWCWLPPSPPNGGFWVVWGVPTATSCVSWGQMPVPGHQAPLLAVAPLACVATIGATGGVAGADSSHYYSMGGSRWFGVWPSPPGVCHRATWLGMATGSANGRPHHWLLWPLHYECQGPSGRC